MKTFEWRFKGSKPLPKEQRPGADVEDLDDMEDLSDVASSLPANSSDPIVSLEDSLSKTPDSQEESTGQMSRFLLDATEPVILEIGGSLRAALDDRDRGERIRALRTELLLRHSSRHHSRAIALVGAGAGEGRSLLAAELAVAFAQLGRSTLVLDADFRSPRQHLLFGAKLAGGLAPALARGKYPRFFSVEGHPNLALVTAGNPPANPVELLSNGCFETLMGVLFREFEFIIVDTPPCAQYADAQVISTLVGHVLSVQRAGHSSHKTVRAMLRQLESSRAEILGAVINHF